MQFIVFFACAISVASAGLIAPLEQIYLGPQHLPIINHEGVPVDTAEVQHARAAHLIQKSNIQARNGDYAILAHGEAVVAHETYAAPLAAYAAPVAAYAAPILAHPEAYPTTAVLPASINGVPLDTPEVTAAKVNHFAAHNEALLRNAHHGLLYRKRRGIFAAHLAYHYGYAGPQHLPIINHEGVPVDTAEVQHARAAHLIQKANVHARNGDFAYAPILAHGAYAAPWTLY